VSVESLDGNYDLEDENETFRYGVAFQHLA
jgi:hypothetical protein